MYYSLFFLFQLLKLRKVLFCTAVLLKKIAVTGELNLSKKM